MNYLEWGNCIAMTRKSKPLVEDLRYCTCPGCFCICNFRFYLWVKSYIHPRKSLHKVLLFFNFSCNNWIISDLYSTFTLATSGSERVKTLWMKSYFCYLYSAKGQERKFSISQVLFAIHQHLPSCLVASLANGLQMTIIADITSWLCISLQCMLKDSTKPQLP